MCGCSTYMRPDIEKFPPPKVAGTPLGHDDDLGKEEIEHLRSLGYDIGHFKSFTGPRLIEAYLEGSVKGLIEFSEKKFKALEAARKHFSKTSKEQAEAGLKDRGEKVDIVRLLMGGEAEVDVGVAPTRRRGRPPGSKNKKEDL